MLLFVVVLVVCEKFRLDLLRRNIVHISFDLEEVVSYSQSIFARRSFSSCSLFVKSNVPRLCILCSFQRRDLIFYLYTDRWQCPTSNEFTNWVSVGVTLGPYFFQTFFLFIIIIIILSYV